METNMIGNKIVEARKRKNISQAQLAEHLFISAQAVGKWERGESLPDIIMLNRLAELLGVDLNYFSENFQSLASVTASVEPLVNQPAEVPSEKQKNRHNWDMSRGNWVGADFSGLKNLHEKFSSSNMQGCKFIDSELSGLLLKTNNVDSCDFSNSDVSDSHIQRSNLHKDIFKNCLLKETEFTESNIERCDFSGANLTGSKFSKSYLYGCEFNFADFTDMVIKSGGLSGVAAKTDLEKSTITNAVWNHTSIIDSQIADIVFDCIFEDCYFENCKFTRVVFRNAILTNTFFKCKSLKRIQFIDCQVDRMTYEFLKNGKADLRGITLLTT